MTGKIQKFLWAMKPDHLFPRMPEENDANYVARYTEQMEGLAAECIDDINADNFDDKKESVRKELARLRNDAAELDSSENMSASICRNAMRLVRCRLISEVLNVFPPKSDDKETSQTGTPTMKLAGRMEDKKVISSTQGLAEFLGCGKTKAFEIIKGGVLINAGIQYRVGKCWKFNAEKLSKYLSEHPDFLK